jgi:hypothetical protein
MIFITKEISMSKLVELLNKEKDLSVLLNSPKCPSNIDDQFKELFNDKYYENTSNFYQKNGVSTLHDSYVKDLSQRKKLNSFDISFKIDSMPIYSENEQIGYVSNSELKISSSDSLRDISNKCILSFLIDEENKELAFLFLENNQRKVIGIKYNDIELIKGQDILYQKSNKLRM